MPKLEEYKWIMDIVFFLYRSEEHANVGKDAGGTGFLVALPSQRWPDHLHHVHGVSNKHVVCRDGCSVMRFNRRDGATEILAFDPGEWQYIPSFHDIAISPQLLFDSRIHKVEALGTDWCMDDAYIRDHAINAAEDVFMLGRFVDYDGVVYNKPAFWFGHISMMEAPIRQYEGFTGSSIIVDMHSRTGYSGSPVFVYRTPGALFARPKTLMMGGHLMKLLGILWGQFPEPWELRHLNEVEHQSHLITDGTYVHGLSGMCCVCPAAAILQILQLPSLVAMRDAEEIAWEKRLGGMQLPELQIGPDNPAV